MAPTPGDQPDEVEALAYGFLRHQAVSGNEFFDTTLGLVRCVHSTQLCSVITLPALTGEVRNYLVARGSVHSLGERPSEALVAQRVLQLLGLKT